MDNNDNCQKNRPEVIFKTVQLFIKFLESNQKLGVVLVLALVLTVGALILMLGGSLAFAIVKLSSSLAFAIIEAAKNGQLGDLIKSSLL